MRLIRLLLATLLTAFFPSIVKAQTAEWKATPCTVAPRINGVEGRDEWRSAARFQVTVPMISGQRQPRGERRAEVRLMNSATNLYVALSIPDSGRDMQLSPLVTDMALLVFCRSEEVTQGDDRRLVMPGGFIDKHFVPPAADADDTQRDGKAAMHWSAEGGGRYFIEWQVPLDSKDPNDIAAASGGRLRFNVLYGDRFSAGFTETEFGGLFGADPNHAAGWGTIVLAATSSAEAPPPAPGWAERLFFHTGRPDHFAKRLSRRDADEIQADNRIVGSVIVELQFPGIDGRDETGQARLILPPELLQGKKGAFPLIHAAGYELDEATGAALAARGYVVSTPHAHPLNPLSRGVNLDNAVLHAARALPWVDPLRVSIQGGSAGGWMTLMLAADTFPLLSAMPDVPPVHWGYNGAYIEGHKTMAAKPGSTGQPGMPVLLSVGPIAETSRANYGMPWESATFLAVSPLAHLDTLTAPILVTYSTADLLVPIDQVDAKLVKPFDPKLFPAGFSTAMAADAAELKTRRTLLNLLGPNRYRLFTVPLSARPSAPTAKALAVPFSKEKRWSIVIFDEGPVEPANGHYKYDWRLDREPFRRWTESAGVEASQLTPLKLERLMKRLAHQQWRPFRVGGKSRQYGNMLDYPEAERADVIRGLLAFAADDKRATRLIRLYQLLPAELRIFDRQLGKGPRPVTPQRFREALTSFPILPPVRH